jgi:hypothetical protein
MRAGVRRAVLPRRTAALLPGGNGREEKTTLSDEKRGRGRSEVRV